MRPLADDESRPNHGVLVKTSMLHDVFWIVGYIERHNALGEAGVSKSERRARQALLIGVNEYDFLGELSYAHRDAEVFSQALVDHCGFELFRGARNVVYSPRRPQSAGSLH